MILILINDMNENMLRELKTAETSNHSINNRKEREWNWYIFVDLHLPTQEKPSPLKPVWHEQVYEPNVLVHTAFPSHLCRRSVHSFISKITRQIEGYVYKRTGSETADFFLL